MNLFYTHISKESLRLANEVLHSSFLNQGPMVEKFEKALSKIGLVNPVTVNCGTSALHLALVLEGVGPGDEVVLPPQTFIATGLAILMCGAKPVFADVDQNGNLNPFTLGRALSERTKAVIAVHWGGVPCKLNLIHEVLKPHPNSPTVIEDAAHALGAIYKGRKIGSISPYTAFSFQSIKMVTCGDGGALCVLDQEKAERARRLRWFGMDKKTPRTPLGDRVCEVSEPGYKYHMNDLAAAVGLGNLSDLRDRLARRQNIAQRYREELWNTGLTLPWLGFGDYPSYWLFTVKVEQRDKFVRAMYSRGIPCSVVDRRIDKHPVFGDLTPNLTGAEYFDAHQVSLPIHEALSDEDVDKVIQAVKAGW